jgi:hypothetical protein
VYNVQAAELAVAFDELIAEFLWNLIDDSQTPDWVPVANTQAQSWATTDDSQTPGWTSIANTQPQSWSEIDDNQDPNWQNIPTM